MKQAIWVVNISIVGFLVFSLAILQVLNQEPVQVTKLAHLEQQGIITKKPAFPDSHWEPIFKHDLFGTYVQQATQPVQKNLVTAPPEVPAPFPQAIPEPTTPEFVPALTLSIKGIIVASDEMQNVAMIEDETKKEAVYHVGDMYKDGQIIKISRNSVVFLRASGQQEAFYLRKEDADLAMDGPAKWEYIIKKLENSTWQVDPESFKHEIDSLGGFLNQVGVIGTAYQQGSAIGVRIGNLGKESLGSLLGFEEGDILISIDETSVDLAANRVAIFDKISASTAGSAIIVKLKRHDAEVSQTYKLAYIDKAKRMLFGDNKAKDTAKPEEELKMSKLQEREKQQREFSERHENTQQRDAVAQIRKRLLDNLRTRLQGARTHQ